MQQVQRPLNNAIHRLRLRLAIAPALPFHRCPNVAGGGCVLWQSVQKLGLCSRTMSLSMPEIFPVLLADLNLDVNQATRLLARHSALEYCGADATREVLTFLRDEVGITRAASLSSTIRKNPQLLTVDLATLRVTLADLKTRVSTVALQSIVSSCPAALLLSPSELEERHQLLESIGTSLENVARGYAPLLLREWDSIKSNFDFLVGHPEGPGFTPTQAARLSKKYPMLLTYDPHKQIAPLVRFLRQQTELDPADTACECFYAHPSAQELEVALRFLLTSCGYTLSDVQAQVSVLAYSFQQSIQPRGTFVQRRGFTQPPLAALAKWDDVRFCSFLGVELEEFQDFVEVFKVELRTATNESYTNL